MNIFSSISNFIFIKSANAASILGRMDTVAGGSYKTDATTQNPLVYAGQIISVVLGLLGVIFLVIIVNAGYGWMMAQGDATKITKSKDEIWRAVIGLLIIVGAYAIQFYIFDRVVYQR